MATFVIYDSTSGLVKASFTANNHDDAEVMANNTPEGCAAMAVDPSSPIIAGQKGWAVINGVLTLVPPTPAELLVTAQVGQTAVIEAAYENVVYNTAIAYMGTTFWTDQQSQTLLTGALVVLGKAGAVPDGFKWGAATGVGVAMTLADLQGLAAAILARMNTNFWKHKALQAEIDGATTVEAVQAIVWQ